HLRTKAGCPAASPKPSRPGPGRPPGHPNRHRAARHDVHIVTAATSNKPNSNTKKTKTSNSPRPRRKG
ncbi:transposase, partial [Micromonospora sp. KC207]